jgi:hypothetical protein
MDALACPVCRRRIAAGAAVCSLSCGAILVFAMRPVAPVRRLALVPPAAEVSGEEVDLGEAQAELTGAA